jgi:23S rRNA pseudouridine1911/1915/1917 synthase
MHLGAGARPHLVNRLDRETSGVTLVAKRDDAALELRRIWESRAVEKEYLAIVHDRVATEHGVIEAPLGRDESSRVAIKNCVRPDGARSRTEFWVERHFTRAVGAPVSDPARGGEWSGRARSETRAPFTLLRVVPHTGRKHQIRIHLAHMGHAVVGDKLYGEDEDSYLALVEDRLTDQQRARLMLPHHALHAAAVHFCWRDRECIFRAPPEAWFAAFVPGDR